MSNNKVNVAPTAEAVRDMGKTLGEYARRMEALASRIEKSGDLSYAADAANEVANCLHNLRIDLLVSRPLDELVQLQGELDALYERARDER